MTLNSPHTASQAINTTIGINKIPAQRRNSIRVLSAFLSKEATPRITATGVVKTARPIDIHEITSIVVIAIYHK